MPFTVRCPFVISRSKLARQLTNFNYNLYYKWSYHELTYQLNSFLGLPYDVLSLTSVIALILWTHGLNYQFWDTTATFPQLKAGMRFKLSFPLNIWGGFSLCYTFYRDRAASFNWYWTGRAHYYLWLTCVLKKCALLCWRRNLRYGPWKHKPEVALSTVFLNCVFIYVQETFAFESLATTIHHNRDWKLLPSAPLIRLSD